MDYPEILHHGATGGVTGSCHQLQMDAEHALLVDSAQLTARIGLQCAGHNLGSAYAEVDLHYPETGEKKRIVFSGDLGAPHTPILPAPKAPYKADILVIESTYGDRLHPQRSNRRRQLEAAIDHALADLGTLLIPAFSLGRTQELLYEIEDILHHKSLLSDTAASARDGDFLLRQPGARHLDLRRG